MKINTENISGYSEMSAEEKLSALENYEFDDNTAELDRLKNAVSKANSEAAEWKKKHNALLTEDEKRKAEEEENFKSMKEELETLRHESAVAKYTANYVELGMDKELAKSTAEAFIKGENDTVFANMQKSRENYRKSIEKELLDKTPKPDGNGGTGGKDTDKAVEKAKELAKAKTGVGKDFNDIMGKYTNH